MSFQNLQVFFCGTQKGEKVQTMKVNEQNSPKWFSKSSNNQMSLKIPLYMFNRRKKIIQVCNHIRVSKWWWHCPDFGLLPNFWFTITLFCILYFSSLALYFLCLCTACITNPTASAFPHHQCKDKVPLLCKVFTSPNTVKWLLQPVLTLCDWLWEVACHRLTRWGLSTVPHSESKINETGHLACWL